MKRLLTTILILGLTLSASADYSARTEYAVTAAFQQQVHYAMINAAGMILGEDPETAKHVERCAYAQKVDLGAYNINSVSLKITTNSTVGEAIDASGTPTDAEIQAAVNGFWNQWAGVISE